MSPEAIGRVRRPLIVACVALVASAAQVSAQEPEPRRVLTMQQPTTDPAAQPPPSEPAPDLTEMPLEALMNLEVTSVSKKPQRVADAAAAIFVLTQEDIRRSGATTIPEALRLVPGLYVARVDSNVWVVNARGFAGRFSTQFLVLVDGRAVYTPSFAGVFWDVVDMPLEDIDRIEVIRGPGAALWGANAVNGIINIITKRARDTLGGLVSGGTGSEENGFGTLRYGVKLGDVAVRVYSKYLNRDEFVLDQPRHDGAGDQWEIFRSGVRADAEVSERDTLTLIGNWYKGTVGETAFIGTLIPPVRVPRQVDQRVEGVDVTTRWVRTISPESSLQLQLYYDRETRDDLRIPGTLQTADGELQYRFPLWTFNDVITGLGYRYHHLETGTGNFGVYIPPTADLHLFNVFVQDDVTLIKRVLHLILGTKVEHTTYTGLEWEPNARLLWTPAPAHTLWGAVSRAVRTPSIAERQEYFTAVAPPNPPAVPVAVVFQTRPDSDPLKGFQSEKLLAYEAGYRGQVRPELAFDLVAFYHYYTDLQLEEFQSATFNVAPAPHLLLTSRFKNGYDSEVYGIEFLTEVDPVNWWRFRGTYTWLERHDYRHVLTFLKTNRNRAPSQQASLRSLLDLGRGFEFDVTPRWVYELPEGNARDYIELDARLGWRSRAVEMSLVGRNMLHSEHLEYNSIATGGPVKTAVQREVLLKMTVKF